MQFIGFILFKLSANRFPGKGTMPVPVNEAQSANAPGIDSELHSGRDQIKFFKGQF
ncbi:MAG TPA: hypothetical protein PLJ84_09570 [Bacteroidales bacterium]|nr:hypothetical protein [Bacteroidales bacterium]